MPVISKFADNAKNAIEQKDIKLTGEMATQRFLQDGRVGGKWQMSFNVGKCGEQRSGDNQEKHGSLLTTRGMHDTGKTISNHQELLYEHINIGIFLIIIYDLKKITKMLFIIYPKRCVCVSK